MLAEDLRLFMEENWMHEAHIIGHSMGGKVAMLAATMYPNLINKLVIADIGPKYYPVHHQTILEALNEVDFSLKPSRQDVEAIITKYIKDNGTRQFLLKNLFWKEKGQLAFRFNLEVFNRSKLFCASLYFLS